MRPFEPGELTGASLSLLDRPFKMNAGESVRVAVSVANGSGVAIGTFRFYHPNPMFLGYIWTDRTTGQNMPPDYVLTSLPRALHPGQHCVVHTRVRAPRAPGRYLLWIMLVQNHVRWYDSSSEVKPVQIEIEVGEDLAVLPHSINDYEDSVFSQNGEDGILRELFLRLGFANPFAVEFGAGDGLENITAYWLRQYGWRGLLIEGDPELFARIQDSYANYAGVTLANEFVTAENIVDVFRRYGVPGEFDLLSIDIDGNDYWLWEALADYRPRVVVIENNRTFAPPQLWVMKYNPHHAYSMTNKNYHGASLESLAKLGKRLGYALLGTDDEDINAFFVRQDLLARSRFPELTAGEAFHTGPHTFPPGFELNYDGPYAEQ